ncbi:MAG: DUF2059 domain-containing protein [Balneolaceae bacterium]
MKTFCSMIVILLISMAGLSAQEISERQFETAKDLLRIMEAEQITKRSIEVTINNLVAQNPGLELYQGVIKDFILTYLSWEVLEDEYAWIYSEVFTEDELLDLIRFFKSETGYKYATQTPFLLEKGMQIGQKKVLENIEELQRMILNSEIYEIDEISSGIDVLETIEGDWDWEHTDEPCTNRYFTISASPDKSKFLLRYPEQPLQTDENEYQSDFLYNIQEVQPRFVRAQIEGETRLTDNGEPVIWDLMVISSDELCWRRTDWNVTSCTNKIIRCQKSNDK